VGRSRFLWTLDKKELTVTETTMTTQRADDLPERWSAQREMEIVLRLASTVAGAMYRG
jgi:hypothetical protein